MNSLNALKPCLNLSSPLRAFKLASCFALCFAVVGCDTLADTLYCRVLRSGFSDQTIYARRWVTAADGGLGGLEGDYKVYPFLEPYNRSHATTHFVYWPKGYTSFTTPVMYAVVGDSSLSIDNIPSNQVPNVANSLSSMFPDWESSAAINGINVTYDNDGTPVISVSTYPPGRIVGNAVSTFDSSGRPVLALPDSTGYVPGYEPGIDGLYTPVWYDTHSGGSQAIVLTSLNNSNSAVLSYDTETGLYSFQTPDYSAQLSAIHETLRNQRLTVDNINLEVPAPDVTVNVPAPEVTVNVPAPEVTVNVPAPEVTVEPPDVTVNVLPPEVTVEAPVVNVDTSSIVDSLNSSSSVTDPVVTPLSVSSDEQHILDEVSGWNDQIPLIGDVFGSGMDFLVGRIPSIGHDLEAIPSVSIAGFEFGIDFTDYAQPISWLRALCLLSLIVGFVHVVWSTVVQSLQI